MAAIIKSSFSRKIKLTSVFIIFLSLLFSAISLSTNIPQENIIWLLLVSILFCVLLFITFFSIGTIKYQNAPVYLSFLSFLVAYLFQLAVLIANPDIAGFDLWIADFISDEKVIFSFAVSFIVAISGYCLGVLLVSIFRKKKNNFNNKNTFFYFDSKRLFFWFLVLLFLSVSTALIIFIFGISHMGGEGTVLPFRLNGLIFYIRTDLIPLLITFSIYACMIKKNLRYVTLFLALLIFHALTDMTLRSSRGFLIQVMLSVFFLFIFMGKFDLKRLFQGALVIGFTAIMVPLIGIARGLQTSTDIGTFAALYEGIVRVMSSSDLSIFELFFNSLAFLFVRFTGAVTFLQVLGRDYEFIGLGILEPGFRVTNYMTYEVMGWSTDQAMGYAPGTLGYFYLIGGNFSLFWGMFLIGFLSYFLWIRLSNIQMLSKVPFMAFLLSWYFMALADGSWDNIGFRILILIFLGIVVEIFARLSSRRLKH